MGSQEILDSKMPYECRWKRVFFLVVGLVVVASGIVFIQIQFHKQSFLLNQPIQYTGDAIAVLAFIKAAEEGDFRLGLPKRVQRLNAPYEGWWSDYPITDWVFWIPGQFAKFGDCFMAANWAVVGALALAGVSFYFCALAMGCNVFPAATLGILFGIAPYGFVRQLEHLMLTWYFVVPVGIFVAWRLQKDAIPHWQVGILLCVLSFLCGLFNPYYVAVFLLLLGVILLSALLEKDWRKVQWILLGILAAGAGFTLQNLDVFLHRFSEGSNPVAVSRDLWWMIKFGLYLPDLVLPKFHTLDWVRDLAGRNYHYKIPDEIAGESQTAYIGIVAAVTLLGLVIIGVARIFSSAPKLQNPFFAFALVVFVFAVVGGANYLLGAFGFQLLRGSNRYSIFLMCIGLFALAVFLSQRLRTPWMSGLASFVIGVIGVVDQVPHVPDWQARSLEEGWEQFHQDKEFFAQVEAILPEGASVFLLPVHLFPEMGPVHRMGDYEHFRPYLHTEHLRFSYGTAKGREHMRWQTQIDFLSFTNDALRELEARNFTAILLNRRAYEDEGRQQENALLSVGCKLLLKNKDFLLFALPEIQIGLPKNQL